MKKKVLIMTCVLAAAGVVAQSHSFRDTSYVRYQQFDFDAWVREDSLHNCKAYNRPLYPGPSRDALAYDDILQYNYTANPAGLRVVGLSATIWLDRRQVNPNAPPEYLFLYEVSPDTFELKAQVQWDETDYVNWPDDTIFLNENRVTCQDAREGYSGHYMWTPSGVFQALKIFDHYFDKPITVYDSFYVGGTDHSYMGIMSPEPMSGSYSYYMTFRKSIMYDSSCVPCSLWKMYHYRELLDRPQYQWHWMPTDQFMMVLPIIEVVDSSFANAPVCPVVSGLFLRGNYTDTVTLRWDYDDSTHHEYQLWYGPEDGFDTRSAIVPLRTNKWVFSDASYADVQMIAYVRTVCHEYDTLRYSEWSSPLRFMLHHQEQDTTGHGDMGVPEAEDDLSRYVQLMPNPASGSVLVSSSYGINRVEAYDVRGEKVMEQPTEGRTAIIDVTAWPKGAYVLLVRTPQGTAAKRLVVQ